MSGIILLSSQTSVNDVSDAVSLLIGALGQACGPIQMAAFLALHKTVHSISIFLGFGDPE